MIPVFKVISVNKINGKSEGNTLPKNISVVFFTDLKLTLPKVSNKARINKKINK